MWNDDRHPEHQLRARDHYEFFIMANSIIVSLLILPSFFFIRDSPPTPPSKIASKKRPNLSFYQATKMIMANKNYLMVFINFQLVNCVTIFGAEITTFLKPYP